VARGLPRVGATRRVRVGTLSEGISGGIVFALKDRGLFPRWRVPRPAVADNVFYVIREVWVENRGLAGFFLVRFGQRDAFGDTAAHRLGGMKDGDGPSAIFNDDLLARAHACHQRSEVASRFRLGDVDHILSHKINIHRSFALCSGRAFTLLLGLCQPHLRALLDQGFKTAEAARLVRCGDGHSFARMARREDRTSKRTPSACCK
jgi:hypothetical protein